MNHIETALQIAMIAHSEQKDKGGKPYILHPMKVASMQKKEECIITALLHDVVEDSSYTIDDLRMHGFSEEILEAVRLLTHDEDIPYVYYILAIKDNDIARSVKIADLLHNSDLSRLETVTPEDEVRCRKYNTAMHLLSQNFNSEEFLYSY